MAYEPLSTEFTVEEREFLGRLAPLGLDWTNTREDFARRLGISRYFDWADVVTLPPSNALSDVPLELRMYAEPGLMDLPPEYLFAPFMPYDDARKNHREIEAQLRARLGEPTTADSSNCLIRAWRFGLFAVEIHTFPPDLQDPRWRSSNELLRKNPRLGLASSVTVKSDYAHACPDGSLTVVADFLNAVGTRGPGAAAWLLTSAQMHDAHLVHPSRRYSRRNPRCLIDVLGKQIAVWSDATNRIGLSGPSDSLVFPRASVRRLILTRIEPARGSGGSSLELELETPMAASGSTQRASLFSGSKMDSLAAFAPLLADWWALPLEHETGLDD